jgi:hypothetical protein
MTDNEAAQKMIGLIELQISIYISFDDIHHSFQATGEKKKSNGAKITIKEFIDTFDGGQEEK